MAKRRRRDRRFKYDPKMSDRIEIYDWCMDNLGHPGKKTWTTNRRGRFYIIEPESIMAFKLRWI